MDINTICQDEKCSEENKNIKFYDIYENFNRE